MLIRQELKTAGLMNFVLSGALLGKRTLGTPRREDNMQRGCEVMNQIKMSLNVNHLTMIRGSKHV
jgi:hypothetical protein